MYIIHNYEVVALSTFNCLKHVAMLGMDFA